MRGRLANVSDRVLGIALGILLGLVIILLFLFLGSRDTIDEPSVSGDTTQTAQPATIPGQSLPKPPQ
jgi:uncharacterized membrane protein required for colicin V production